jgi:hypothetical protein
MPSNGTGTTARDAVLTAVKPSALPPPLIVFTIARAQSGTMAKRISRTADGQGFAVQQCDKERLFRFNSAEAPDTREFGRSLVRLSRDTHAAVLRGEPLPGIRPDEFRLRRYNNPDRATNSLRPCPRAWLAVDMDDVPARPGLDWLRDPVSAGLHALTLLPVDLREASFVVQLTGSAGFKLPDEMRLRLWFGLTALVSDEDAKRWAKAWNTLQGSKIIDWTIYRADMPHYTANPVLAPGIADPVPQRWAFHAGLEDRAGLDVPPDEAPVSAAGRLPRTSVGLEITHPRGFEEWCSAIGSVEHGFFGAISGTLGAAVASSVDGASAVVGVRAAVLAAPPGHRSRETIARYADPRWLKREFDSLAKVHAARRHAAETRAAALFPSLRGMFSATPNDPSSS